MWFKITNEFISDMLIVQENKVLKLQMLFNFNRIQNNQYHSNPEIIKFIPK